MSLIAILLSLFAESYWRRLERWRRYDWLDRYVDAMLPWLDRVKIPHGPVTVLAIMLPIGFVVWLLEAMLAGVWGGFAYLFDIAILIFCVGPKDLNWQVQQYLHAIERGDEEASKELVCEILGEDAYDENAPMQVAEGLREMLLTQIVDRILGVFFWFVLLGPIGAVLFRAAQLLEQYGATQPGVFAAAAQRLYQIVYWLPARLCVIGYALAGNFVDTMSYWNSMADLWERESRDLLIVSGVGALRQDMRGTADQWAQGEEIAIGVSHTLALVKRTVIIWLVVLALLTLAGWLL